MSNKVIRICAIVVVVLLLVAVIAFISINVVRESKKANFYFKIQGEDSSFYATAPDVTEFFEIDMQEEYFTLTLDEKFKATDVIEWVYSDKSVYFPDEVDCSKSYYQIVVHLKDGTTVYRLPFRCEYEAEGLNIGGGTPYFGGGFSEDCNFGS